MSTLREIAVEIEELEADLAKADRRMSITREYRSGDYGFSPGFTESGNALMLEILQHAITLPLAVPIKRAFELVAKRRIFTLAQALREGAEARLPGIAEDVRAAGVYTLKRIAGE